MNNTRRSLSIPLFCLLPAVGLVSGCSTTGPSQPEMVYFAAAEDQALPKGARFNPVQKDIEGWTVSIEPSLLPGGEFAEEGEQAIKMLANHLQRIVILLPKERLAEMRTIGIWLEHHHPELGAMQYHPSKQWLIGQGHDPRLEKKVHIPHAAALSSRGQMLKHPAVILHELAHAYHDQVLGFEDPRVIKAYDNAMQKKLYDKVMLYTGQEVRHYATTNHKEYFSEMTESYFYRNDFYPFVQGELKQYDPTSYELMEQIWGPLR